MADNKKTYTAVIDVETNDAAKNIDLLNRTVSTSLGEFDNLNEAISKTQDTLGKIDPNTEEFKELSKELQGLKDNLQDTEIASKRFTEALAEQPGIIGLIGGSLEGLRGTIKIFAANPLIAVLAATTGAFLSLKESLERTEEGQAKLSRISEALSSILDGLFAVVEPIAFKFADFTANLLENQDVVDGLARTFAILQGILVPIANFVSNQLTTAFKGFSGIAGGVGNILKGIFTFDIDTISAGLSQVKNTVVTSFTETAANFKNVGLDIYENLTLGLEEGEERFKDRIQGVARNVSREVTEIQKAGFQTVQAETLTTQEGINKKLLANTKNLATQTVEINKDAGEAEKLTRKQVGEFSIQVADDVTAGLAAFVDENSKVGKAAAVAQAIINTYQAVTTALASYPPPFSFIAAGAQLAFGLKQVSAIKNTKTPQTSRGGAAPSGAVAASTQTPSISAPTIPTIEAPQIQADTGTVDTGAVVADTITEASRRPTRAYVVESDISSQQALARRTQTAGSF